MAFFVAKRGYEVATRRRARGANPPRQCIPMMISPRPEEPRTIVGNACHTEHRCFAVGWSGTNPNLTLTPWRDKQDWEQEGMHQSHPEDGRGPRLSVILFRL
jgi:hypothetical protein